jgi:hypothetical protein
MDGVAWLLSLASVARTRTHLMPTVDTVLYQRKRHYLGSSAPVRPSTRRQIANSTRLSGV